MLIYTSPTTTIHPPAYHIQDIRPRYANLFIPISSATHQRVSSRQADRQSHLLHRRYTSIYVYAGIYRYANPLAWQNRKPLGQGYIRHYSVWRSPVLFLQSNFPIPTPKFRFHALPDTGAQWVAINGHLPGSLLRWESSNRCLSASVYPVTALLSFSQLAPSIDCLTIIIMTLDTFNLLPLVKWQLTLNAPFPGSWLG